MVDFVGTLPVFHLTSGYALLTHKFYAQRSHNSDDESLMHCGRVNTRIQFSLETLYLEKVI